MAAGKYIKLSEIAYQYVEAQIHGGVTTADIEKVVLHYKPDNKTKAALAAAGVKYEISRASIV